MAIIKKVNNKKEKPNISKKNWNSIKRKMVIAIFMMLLISNLVIGLISYNVAKNELNEQGKKLLINSVRMVHQLIDTKQEEVEKGSITLDEAQEQVKAYILGEKRVDGTRPINKNIDLGKYGYLITIDKNGLEIAHPTLEGINVWEAKDKSDKEFYFVQDAIKKSINGGGFTYYSWNLPSSDKIESKIIYSEIEDNWDWIVVAGSYMSDYNYGADRILKALFITLLISSILGVIVNLLLATHISTPISKMSKALEEVSKGNFSISKIQINNKDETKALSQSFNTMLDNLKNLTKIISNSSCEVLDASKSLENLTEHTMKATDEVAIKVQEIASGASEQAKNIEKEVLSINELAIKIEEVYKAVELMNSKSNETMEFTDNGIKIVNELIEKSKENNNAVIEVNKIVLDVDRSIDKIGNITEVISQIAEQTNLLALNATIESARAGEAGKGFSVVAQEIRRLAEQSSSSVQIIRELIDEIQSKSRIAVESIDKSKSIAKSQSNAVSKTIEIFKEISTSVRNIIDKVSEIKAYSYDISTNKNGIVDLIENNSVASEETSAYAQEVAAATQENLASMHELSKLAQCLKKLANELEEVINHFKI